MYPAGNLFIPAPHGQLEAIYRPKTNQSERVALVLHPHPLHGGTMHNKVVFRAAKALAESGFETMRFNFRGVGASTGKHDDGIGERDDARVALEYLLADQPNAREVIVAGFSFGSIVGLNVGCADARVHRLIAIGVPARLGQLECLFDCAKPKLFIHGVDDVIAPLAPLEEFLAKLPANSSHQLVSIAGAGHFFDDQANELMQTIKDFVGKPD
ncbi:MAG TPA: alpha/beta fold hydrolase [Blastocatellia bacterium]|nr:alpha/beta fold hydrolase [Blastocatellia bacterium]